MIKENEWFISPETQTQNEFLFFLDESGFMQLIHKENFNTIVIEYSDITTIESFTKSFYYKCEDKDFQKYIKLIFEIKII